MQSQLHTQARERKKLLQFFSVSAIVVSLLPFCSFILEYFKWVYGPLCLLLVIFWRKKSNNTFSIITISEPKTCLLFVHIVRNNWAKVILRPSVYVVSCSLLRFRAKGFQLHWAIKLRMLSFALLCVLFIFTFVAHWKWNRKSTCKKEKTEFFKLFYGRGEWTVYRNGFRAFWVVQAVKKKPLDKKKATNHQTGHHLFMPVERALPNGWLELK